jgi:hypothetical protein
MELFSSNQKPFIQFTTHINTLTNNKEKEKIKCNAMRANKAYTQNEKTSQVKKNALKKIKFKGDKLIELGEEESLKFIILRLEFF